MYALFLLKQYQSRAFGLNRAENAVQSEKGNTDYPGLNLAGDQKLYLQHIHCNAVISNLRGLCTKKIVRRMTPSDVVQNLPTQIGPILFVSEGVALHENRLSVTLLCLTYCVLNGQATLPIIFNAPGLCFLQLT
jgi:hypothetical protein